MLLLGGLLACLRVFLKRPFHDVYIVLSLPKSSLLLSFSAAELWNFRTLMFELLTRVESVRKERLPPYVDD